MAGNLFTKLCFSILIGGITLPLNAARVDSTEARQMATEFFKARKGESVSLELCSVGGTSNNPLYYVFNNPSGGFVIISAEDTTLPVIGYSLENSYDVKNVPASMAWVLDGIGKEIKAASTLQPSMSLSERKMLSAPRAAGESRLLPTPSWSQEAPFNNAIPGNPLVGCVGTAMASIMKYYQFPAQGHGDKGGVSFETAYDWDNMRSDNYRGNYSATEAEAVATLMWHAAKSIDTQFGMSGSSAYEVRVPGALSLYFGYDPGVSYKKRADVASQAEWDNLVKNEILAGRPVLYCGQDVSAGHAFVCDGFDGEGLFHFNWGWGGSANGYFRTTMLNPTVSRTHSYNNLNTIIYNIKPGTASANWSTIRITADGNQIGLGSDMANLKDKKIFTVRVGNLKNVGFSDFNGKLTVALFSADGSFKTSLSSPVNLSLQSLGYLFDNYKDITNCRLPEGITVEPGDVVRLATQSADSFEWLPVAGELLTTNELDANRTTPSYIDINLPSVAGVTIQGDNKVLPGWKYTFNVIPANPERDVVTVKANGYVLEPSGTLYTLPNVCSAQEISVSVSDIADVKERRSVWVENPGTLAEILSEEEASLIKDLSIFGAVDARDFEFIKKSMPLNRLDISSARIYANGSNQANAIPREAFRGMSKLSEVILPGSINRINNGAFRQCGIKSIVIPAGVATYEYNVFVACSALRDIWVCRENPEFINWCVLSGVNKSACTLHVPSEAAKNKYAAKENWQDIENIVVEKAPTNNLMAFAVMDNGEVKYESDIEAGKFEKGKTISFTATHIADNDNKMTVYANNNLLSPNAEGVYTLTLNDNTIVHFNIETPLAVTEYPSQWSLNGNNGSIGLFTDAVNVIPGHEFTIRANAFNVPQGFEQLFWAAALTDANGNIKEFISPVTVFSGAAANNHKMNVNCCVNEATVREGNFIRLVTSVNKKQWSVVKAAAEGIVDALPAINNVTPVYNINVPEVENATVSGVPETAVRGRDLTLKVVPKSSGDRVNLFVNGVKVQSGVPSVNYSFVALEDLNFDIDIFDPKAGGVATFTVAPGTFHVQLTQDNVAETVVVNGEVYSSDIQAATGKDFAIKTIKTLDLSGAKIVAQDGYAENVVNHPFFVYTNGMTTPASVVENIILPDNVEKIAGGVFKNCAKIKEITLPKNLRSVPVIPTGSRVYQYGLDGDTFMGCDNLTTIYIPGAPGVYYGKHIVAHHNPYSSKYSNMYEYFNLGHKDPKKVTVIVPEEYVNIYRTAYSDLNYGNPWKAHGYNILSEYPVYSLNYDVNNLVATDANFDTQKAASFLGDNVALESVAVDNKLCLKDPALHCKVFDNGVEVEPAEDGTISVTFYNPAKKPALSGNHDITVVPLYNLAINKTSELFNVKELKAENETANYASVSENGIIDASAGTVVSFALDFAAEHDNTIAARVKVGEEVIEPDASGIYSIEINNKDLELYIFAVPQNGAVLNADELAAVDTEEAKAITSLGISGDIDEESLRNTLETFSSLTNINLSQMQTDIPEGAFSGLTDLEGVVLPPVSEIKSNTFSGCSSLSDLSIPESVSSIGEGAFNGCASLQSITLNGIESIGSNAFNGCESLTSISLLASTSGQGTEVNTRSMKQPKGLHKDAFAGVNPNCLIYAEENAMQPATDVNYIKVTHGTITDIQPDGSTLEREGRIYTANTDIDFSNLYTLSAENAIIVPAGKSVTLKATLKENQFNSLVVPFNVQTISDGNSPIVLGKYPLTENTITAYTLATGTDNFINAEELTANVPYLAEPKATSELTFKAYGPFTLAPTPQDMTVEGETFSLDAVYKSTQLAPETSYILNGEERRFDLINSLEEDIEPLADEIHTVNPFSVYAISNSGVPTITPEIENVPSLINEITVENGLSVAKDGDNIVIYSDSDRDITIYNTSGIIVALIHVKEGANTIKAPEPGIYVLNGTKIKF